MDRLDYYYDLPPSLKDKVNLTRLFELAARAPLVIKAGLVPVVIPPDIYSAQVANPDYVAPNLPRRLVIVTWLCIAVPLVCVVVRFVSRVVSGSGVGLDDYFAGVTWLTSTAFATTSLFAASVGGMGTHIWLLSDQQLQTGFLIGYYHQIAYGVASFFLHITILFFYMRLIPPEISLARQVLYVFVAFHIVYLPAFVITSVIQCLPVRAGYDLRYRLMMGAASRCLDPVKEVTALTVIGIVTDCILFFLPLTVVWRLRLTTAKKIMISGLFLIAGLACIASIVRLRYLLRFYKSFDRSYTSMIVNALGHVEIALGLICACLPTMRQAVLLIPRSRLCTTVSRRFGWRTRGGGVHVRVRKIVSGSSRVTSTKDTALQDLSGAREGNVSREAILDAAGTGDGDISRLETAAGVVADGEQRESPVVGNTREGYVGFESEPELASHSQPGV
ncbi:hypothetical protein TWF696_001254 [Orbilia brochopaga]|uniref:Rhodopsin domain-containing protein n=1 Tax=Orbilia brochopaga TaxID=3140254 RepID=A0AAV9UAH2_9PEZI